MQPNFFARTLFSVACTFYVATAHGQAIPAGYPADYAAVISKAKQEGSVAIYTSTDQAQSQPLLDAFKAAYPGIEIQYNDLGTTGTFNRVISEAAAKQVGADVVWTSAMDLQLVLVERGLAETYKSPEAASLPGWAVYKDAAYGTTIEPEAIVYNKRLLPDAAVPKTRADLIKFLTDNKDKYRGKTGAFDPEKSGTGFIYFSHDSRNDKNFWALTRAFGAAGGKVYGSSGALREKVLSGEHVLAFNVIGSYAMDWAKKSPMLGVVYTTDYTSAFSRVALITKGAKHPNAARLFLDFMLSEKGQKVLAAKEVPSIRSDFDGLNLTALNKQVGGNLSPIKLDKALIDASEQKRRVQFFQEWKKNLNAGK